MSSSRSVKSRVQQLSPWRRWAVLGCVGIGLFCLTIALQHRLGAYSALFENDAAAHYVTAAAVRDWLANGSLGTPLRFLVEYHAHYPLTNIGAWPPLFYAVAAGWMLLLPGDHAGMLWFSAAVTTALALVTVLVQLRAAGSGWMGWLAGIAVGLALLLSPVIQRASAELMLDVAVAIPALAAALAYARYLEKGEWRWSVAFAVLASIALMTKGNAACLALLPPLAVLLARRTALAATVGFWAAPAVVLVLVGPWYVLTFWRVQEGARYAPGWIYIAEAVPFYGFALFELVGPLCLLLGVVALLRALLRGARPVEAAAGALALASVLFHLLYPMALQDRYIITALPPFLLLAAYELRRWCRRSQAFLLAAAFLLLPLQMLTVAWRAEPLPPGGLAEAARATFAARDPANPVVLVVGDAVTEPALVAELAATDPARPSLWAIRGSRLLGSGGYNNADYRPRFASAAPVLAELSAQGVPLVLFRQSGRPGEWAHVAQLEAARNLDPAAWRLLSRVPHPGGDVLLYALPAQAGRAVDPAALIRLSGPRALMSRME